MKERENQITMKGDPLTLLGPELAVGQPAPDFKVLDSELEEVSLSDLDGNTVIIAAVPSVDTSVCATETRTFNEKAADLSDDIRILTISMDLPFALDRFCSAEGIDQVTALSDHRDASFGKGYGVLIKELRLLARSVFVVNADGTLVYKEIVPEVTDEPDYDAALDAARQAIG
jgi:thiol peroxidase